MAVVVLAIVAGALGIALVSWLFLRSAAGTPGAGLSTSFGSRGSRLGSLIARSALRRGWLALRSVLATRERKRQLKERYHMQVAEEATQTLGNMKGALMKLGQLISFAAEFVPQDARDVLERLQAEAPPMSYDIVRQVVEQEFGKPPETLFARFERDALAAASIGQVHRARLHDGSDVVVKVQYPGVGDAIASDLKASEGLAAMLGAVNANIDAHGIVEEIKDRLFEELDYRRELENQQRFGELWAGHPLIRVPRVYPEFSGARVLTQQYCRGLGFADFVEVATDYEKRVAVHAINDFVFDSMNRHCLFNGDPHPGNYIFQQDGGIVFIDYGCVKRFDGAFIADLQALNRALMEDDIPAFEGLVKRMQVVLPDRPYDLQQLWEFFCYHSAPFRKDEVFTFTADWVREAFSVMDPTKQTKINLPKNFVFLNRITFGLNSIMLKLGASENFYQMHRRYHYPEQHRAPALARLGIEIPERFW